MAKWEYLQEQICMICTKKYTCSDKKNIKTDSKHETNETEKQTWQKRQTTMEKKQKKTKPKLRYPVQVSLFLMACAHLSNK